MTAAEAGTMTGAARQLYVSQSAISLGITELERQLGAQLLVRSKVRGLALTEAGRLLLPEAKSLLARSDELRRSMRSLGSGPTGRLAVGCLATIAPFVLPRLLEESQAACPGVAPDFAEGSLAELQELLLGGGCELALLYGVDLRPEIEFDILYAAEPYVLLSSAHPLADSNAIWLADLVDYEAIMHEVPPGMSYFSELLVNAGVTAVIRHRTASLELVRGLVARSTSYSLLARHPAAVVRDEEHGLKSCRIRDEIPPLPVVLAWPSGAQFTRRAAAFAASCYASLALSREPEPRRR